jgi:phosphoribosylformimino-5-aminoimidazole carboxamide ribotide isomerase
MKIIPAIDIMSGKCVRLYQGDPDRQTSYSDNPAEVALSFEDAGAELIHIVDLDGAFAQKVVSWDTVRDIRAAVGCQLEFGGGIRAMDDLKELNRIGINRFILGSSVVQDKPFLISALKMYGPRIIIGVDMKDNRLAVKGWKDSVEIDLFQFLEDLQDLGVKEIIYTDIKRDGAMSGPNIAMLEEILNRTGLDITASGGVSSVTDIRMIKNLKNGRIRGIIIGKAIYEKKLDLEGILSEC